MANTIRFIAHRVASSSSFPPPVRTDSAGASEEEVPPVPRHLGSRTGKLRLAKGRVVALGALALGPLVGLFTPYRDNVLRVAVVYFLVLFALRALGKRELGSMSSFDLVTLMLIPEIVSQMINKGDASVAGGLVGGTTLFTLVFATSTVSHVFPKVDRLLSGEPSLIVLDGRPLARTLDQERITHEELETEMRKHGVDRIDQIRFAVIETDGRFSFSKKGEGDEGTDDEKGP